MNVPAARSAAEASTFCAGEVIGVQREALPLLLWKKVSTPPVGQMIGALSDRLEAVGAAAMALPAMKTAGFWWMVSCCDWRRIGFGTRKQTVIFLVGRGRMPLGWMCPSQILMSLSARFRAPIP